MKLNPLIQSPTAIALAWGTLVGMGVLSVCARADEWDKKTILTVKEPIQVRETLLEPGQYVFKLYNSSSERHVVQIFNRDENHIISTVLAISKERMNPTGDTQFTFWETPAGTAKALRAWFYPGDTIGQEFAYPRQPLQVALLTPPTPPETGPAPTPAETPTESATPPEPAPQPTAMTEPPPQPVETAQATPPPTPPQSETPTPPAQTPSQDSADRSTPSELPKTGSPYPLIGLCGIVLAGAAKVLRLKRPT